MFGDIINAFTLEFKDVIANNVRGFHDMGPDLRWNLLDLLSLLTLLACFWNYLPLS